jgi:hypothetical protein
LKGSRIDGIMWMFLKQQEFLWCYKEITMNQKTDYSQKANWFKFPEITRSCFPDDGYQMQHLHGRDTGVS